MTLIRLFNLFLVAWGLSACSPTPAPQAIVTGAAAPPAVVRPQGQLAVHIRWPRQLQVIPYSTNRITVGVEDANGTRLAAASIDQPTGTGTTETLLPVPAGDGLLVRVEAFQDALKVAEGQAPATVRVNERTTLALHLAPAFAPSITSHAPNGAVGSLIALTGSHFGQSRHVPLAVTFGGIPASAVYRLDDTHLVAMVPPGFSNGAIIVQADGVSSLPSETFWVIQELSTLSATHYTLSRGDSLSLGISARSAAGPLADPNVEWSLGPVDPNAPELMASGSFSCATGSATVMTALATGSGLLQVRSGNLLSTASITVR